MKRLISLGITLAILVFISVPLNSVAQSVKDREDNVCLLLPERRTAAMDSLSIKTNEYQTRASSAEASAQRRQQEVDNTIDTTHQKYDQKFHEWYESYLESLSDESQRQTAAVFMGEFQQLVVERQQAYALARQEFRSGLSQVRQLRQLQAKQSIDEFKTGVDQAFVRAQSACSRANADKKQIREDLIGSLSQARLAYNDFRRSEASYSDQIDPVIDARKKAYAEARRNFEQNFQQLLGQIKSE